MLKKNIPTNLKLPGTIFKYLKRHTYESENICDNFFAHTISQIFKNHSYESENTRDNFFAHILFKFFKKNTYES